MVTAAMDGCLPAALDRLYAAVARLVDPLKEMHDGAIVAAPSLYEQLLGAIPTVMGHGAVATTRRSMAPVWTDALDLRIEIDDETRRWQPDTAPTPARLRALAARPWRPQDTSNLGSIAGRVESWSVSVRSLLTPASVNMCRRRARPVAPRLRSNVIRLANRCARPHCRSSPNSAAPARSAATPGGRSCICTWRGYSASRHRPECSNNWRRRREPVSTDPQRMASVDCGSKSVKVIRYLLVFD